MPMNQTSTPIEKHTHINKKKSTDLYEIENDILRAEKLVANELDKFMLQVPTEVVEKLLERIKLLYRQHVN